MQNYILTVVQCGNISKAAQQLGISQPALSAHIKKIEEQMGIVIFDRTVKPLGLTDAGELYIEYLKKKVDLEKELDERLSDLDELKWGSLAIGGASFFNVSYFPKAIAEFSRRYPNVNIKVVDGSMPEITQMAAAHELDLFIAPPWNMDDSCTYEKIFNEKIFLCVPEQLPINDALKEYRLPHEVVMAGETDRWAAARRNKGRVDFSVFRDQPFIRLGDNQHIGNIMAQLFERHGFSPEGCISVEQTMTSYGLTLAGVGISLITEASVRNGHMKGSPAFYLIDEDLGNRDMFIAYSKHKYLSNAAKVFIDILKKSL